jgi:hypothetical protein
LVVGLAESDGVKGLYGVGRERLRGTDLRETFCQFDDGAAHGRSIKITLLRRGGLEHPTEK